MPGDRLDKYFGRHCPGNTHFKYDAMGNLVFARRQVQRLQRLRGFYASTNSLTVLSRYFEEYPEDIAKIHLNLKGCLPPLPSTPRPTA